MLGHVDHGKTTLLDAIRKSDLKTKEYGGITQHIGAYQIEYQGKKITFIDTPGHTAFAKMRSHGAQVTDLAVLVIAADEGVKPQTKESLSHIKEAKIPFLIAINKIDLADASPERVKKKLIEEGVLLEEYGGDIVSVEVSAKKKQGLDELLEMIVLIAEMEELKADFQRDFEGVVIDALLDDKKGPLATILVKNGSLEIGQPLFTRTTKGKVKAINDEFNHSLKKALPSQAVEVLGFSDVPSIGAIVSQKESVLKEDKGQLIKRKTGEKTEDEKLKIILKTDTQGTLQAVKDLSLIHI